MLCFVYFFCFIFMRPVILRKLSSRRGRGLFSSYLGTYPVSSVYVPRHGSSDLQQQSVPAVGSIGT